MNFSNRLILHQVNNLKCFYMVYQIGTTLLLKKNSIYYMTSQSYYKFFDHNSAIA